MVLHTLASGDLHRRIRALETDFSRISALLRQRTGSVWKSDLCSGMAFLVEDIDRLRAEVSRRACSPRVRRTVPQD